MLKPMRALALVISFALSTSVALGQASTTAPAFDVASVNMHPELGTDMFATWQRALQDQLGLKIEGRKEDLTVLVVDQAAKIPTAN
jgi:uncharacterized protein (TIGR03435 family)